VSSLCGRSVGLETPLMGVVAGRFPVRPSPKPLVYLARSPEDLTSLPYRLLARRRLLAILAGGTWTRPW
jgi:hypothetical protein